MQDRAHQIADRAERRRQRRQQHRDQGPEWARQEKMRREGGGITDAEARRLSAGQTTTYRRGR